MGQSRPDTANQSTIVIRMTTGVFYGLIASVLGVTLLVLVFMVGLRLGGRQSAGLAVVQPAFAPRQPSAAQPAAPQQVVPVQPQVAASDQPIAGPSRPPVGNEVPIGDNPRLALPDLVDTNYVLDFGDVLLDQGRVTLEVLVRNTGVRELVISDVQTTCSCTLATLDQRALPPGGETTLRVTHDPQVMLSHGSADIAHQVLIGSNDPAAPWVEVNMSGTVVQ